MAQDRKRQTDSFLEELEAKYGGGAGKAKGKKKAKKGPDEIDDEEFARIQAGLGGKKKGRQ